MTKISIIGAGNVGAACAFAILNQIQPEELVLVDLIGKLAEGEALDLAHAAVAISPRTRIYGGSDYSLIKDSQFIVITAGKPRTKDTKDRKELLEVNSKIITSICKEINTYSKEAKILMVTNPSTQLSRVAKELCADVISMDNQLDTARLKYYLNREDGLPIGEIKSKVSGEHGEDMNFEINDALDLQVVEKVKKQVREVGMQIINLKGYTNWGISSQVASEIKKWV